MKPTSVPQFHASENFGVPPFEQVRDDVWALAQPMPGDHIPCSFLYLLRDASNDFHVIDPGWESDDNWSSFLGALAGFGAKPTDVRSITATHLHADHLGLAGRMRDASGARLQLHTREATALASQADDRPTRASVEKQADEWQVPIERHRELLALALTDELPDETASATQAPPVIDRLLDDGDRLDVPGFDLVAMHTPGHTAGHLCLRDDARSVLWTGDHVLPTMFAGLGLGGRSETNPLADYVASIARVSEYPEHEALPGHGYRFDGLAERAEESLAHHLARTKEVAEIVGRDPATPIWRIATQLTWTAGFDNLSGFTLYSALSQTEMHRDYVAGAR